MIFKKFISLLLSFLLVANVAFAAQAPVPPSIDIEQENDKDNCEVLSAKLYFPAGDTRGHTVLTKKEVVRECNITKTVRGKCLKWKIIDRHYTQPTTMYDTYDTRNYSDTMGTLMATIGAYDQIEHLWSGWHGFCHIGTVVDFSWAKNPFFWGSLIMSTILEGSQQDKFLSETSLGKSVQGIQESIANQAGEFANKFGGNIVQEKAAESGAAAAQAAYNAAEKPSTLAASELMKAYDAGYHAYLQSLGTCLMASGFNMASALYQFAREDGSGLDCDPVDEVCGPEEEDDQMYEDEIYTADAQQFDDMMEEFDEQYSQGKTDINIHDYIEEIKRENGVVTYRFKKMNELLPPGVNPSKEQMKELTQTMKVVALTVQAGMEVAKIAGCLGGTGIGGVQVPTKDDARLLSVKSGLSAAISFTQKFLGPYGPLIGAAMQIVLNVLTSFKDVDTCHDEGDASEAGKRHERTNAALQFDLCHFVKKKCVDSSWTPSNFFGNNCILYGYYYCCYDQILTKILVEQLKAQLGRNWTHCTGITLSDLNHVSFRQCSDSIKQQYPDGAAENLPDNFDYTSSYQYKGKCINLDEFKEYLRSQVDGEIDMGHFNQFWKDLEDQMND